MDFNQTDMTARKIKYEMTEISWGLGGEGERKSAISHGPINFQGLAEAAIAAITSSQQAISTEIAILGHKEPAFFRLCPPTLMDPSGPYIDILIIGLQECYIFIFNNLHRLSISKPFASFIASKFRGRRWFSIHRAFAV